MTTPVFDADGVMTRQPTREDVEEAALHDTVLHHCLRAYRSGECTYEEALRSAVVWLSKNRGVILKQLTDVYWKSPPTIATKE